MNTYRVTVFEGQASSEFRLRASNEAEAIAAAKQRKELTQTEQGAVVWIQHRSLFVRLVRNKKNQWIAGCEACKGKGQCK